MDDRGPRGGVAAGPKDPIDIASPREAMRGEQVETNSASFKGMERPVVVLGLDLDPAKADRADELRRAIYAATTRARSLLVVVGDPAAAADLGFDELAEQLSG